MKESIPQAPIIGDGEVTGMEIALPMAVVRPGVC